MAQWIPRWDLCEPTHAGVRFRAIKGGVETSAIRPGFYWWWPVTTRTYIVPVVRQSVNLPAQSLETSDGVTLLVSTVMVYEIRDVEKALTQNYDLDDTIGEVAAAAAVDLVVEATHDDFRTDMVSGDLNKRLRDSARRLLKKYGVHVHEARFTDAATHICVRIAGNE